MAWNTPFTGVANSPYTAAQHNAGVRDPLLETAPAKITTPGAIVAGTGTNALAERVPTAHTVGTPASWASNAYTDIPTSVGPTVPNTGVLATGIRALVIISAESQNGSSGVSSYMSYEVSGATTTIPANDAVALKTTAASGYPTQASRALIQGLTAGNNQFRAKYKADGSSTGTWSQRSINVVPF